jgi:FdhD protein
MKKFEDYTHSGLTAAPIKRRQDGKWRDMDDTVAPEVRVTLFWPVREPAGLWAFPKDLDELALGHAKIEFCGSEQVPVLDENGEEHQVAADEHVFRLAPEPAPEPGPAAKLTLDADSLIRAMTEMIEAGGRWDATGCFHRAAALDPERGEFARVVEDIGRHNCIDRLAGWAVKNGRRLDSLVLVITARATASLAAKAAKAGFPALVSRSAVTTAAIAAAEEAGMTLCGFTRDRENRTSVFLDPGGLVAK